MFYICFHPLPAGSDNLVRLNYFLNSHVKFITGRKEGTQELLIVLFVGQWSICGEGAENQVWSKEL